MFSHAVYNFITRFITEYSWQWHKDKHAHLLHLLDIDKNASLKSCGMFITDLDFNLQNPQDSMLKGLGISQG